MCVSLPILFWKPLDRVTTLPLMCLLWVVLSLASKAGATWLGCLPQLSHSREMEGVQVPHKRPLARKGQG